MKKVVNLRLVLLIFVCISLVFSFSCNKDSSNDSNGADQIADYNCNLYWSNYEGINKLQTKSEVTAYSGEISNDSVENGVIFSPYYTLTVNGQNVPVYATRSANGIHSFVYLDVEIIDKTKPFTIKTEFTVTEHSTVLQQNGKKEPSVLVLPQKHGVVATITKDKISAEIKSIGSFSFVFNKKHDQPVTVFVTQKEDQSEIFKNREIVYVEPGNYSTLDSYQTTLFTEGNRVYYFKAGRYQTDMISLPENSVLYLERNAYVQVMPSPTGVKTNAILSSANNVTVAGRGLLDFSACTAYNASKAYNKAGISFNGAEQIVFSGLTVINSQTWTLCFVDCKDLHVYNNLMIAYRIIADGIMLSDCKDAVVEYNFVRTGDDAFETKSTSANGLTERVLFQYNDAWTDKAIAYGCVYESNHDTRGVTFKNNSVGFALGNWSGHLGCCVVQMGNRRGAVIENITFEDIEIYASDNQAILNLYIGGYAGQGEGWGTINNITFKNITVERNSGGVLNVRTYSSDGCSIGDVYLEGVYSNGEAFTKLNYLKEGRFINSASNFDPNTNLHFLD